MATIEEMLEDLHAFHVFKDHREEILRTYYAKYTSTAQAPASDSSINGVIQHLQTLIGKVSYEHYKGENVDGQKNADT